MGRLGVVRPAIHEGADRQRFARGRARLWGVLLAIVSSSCGFKTGLPLAEGYESLGIEVFSNDSLERNLEREMHAALTRTTKDLVDAELVTPGRADLVLRGKVLDYYRRGGIRSNENELVETGLTIRVEAWLWDTRTSQRIAGPFRTQTQVGYILDNSDNEPAARATAISNLAERIVLVLLTEEPVLDGQEDVSGPSTGPVSGPMSGSAGGLGDDPHAPQVESR